MRPLRWGMIGGGEGAFIGAVHRMAARVDGRYQLVAGVFSSDPEKCRRSAAALGVDGVLVVTPYYNKPNRRGLVEHFTRVAAATDKPVMLYNIRGRCVINLEVDLLGELSEIDWVEPRVFSDSKAEK